MLFLLILMYLGTLFLCIYTLKQWRECLIQWTESMAECRELKDRVDEMEQRYCDWDYEDDIEENFGPNLVPEDLLESGPSHNLH